MEVSLTGSFLSSCKMTVPSHDMHRLFQKITAPTHMVTTKKPRINLVGWLKKRYIFPLHPAFFPIKRTMPRTKHKIGVSIITLPYITEYACIMTETSSEIIADIPVSKRNTTIKEKTCKNAKKTTGTFPRFHKS